MSFPLLLSVPGPMALTAVVLKSQERVELFRCTLEFVGDAEPNSWCLAITLGAGQTSTAYSEEFPREPVAALFSPATGPLLAILYAQALEERLEGAFGELLSEVTPDFPFDHRGLLETWGSPLDLNEPEVLQEREAQS